MNSRSSKSQPPQRPRTATGTPGLQWVTTDDGSLTLWSDVIGETYHSGCGAMAESLIVYIKHSGVIERLLAGKPTRVLEVGFGTATDFLLTAAIATACRCKLQYTGLENMLLPVRLLAELHRGRLAEHARLACQINKLELPAGTFEQLEPILELLLANLSITSLASAPADATTGSQTVQVGDYVELRLELGDACEYLAHEPCETFDGIYFDPFSPESAPELWTSEVLRSTYAWLQPAGTLTTYCVKSDIRRKLTAAGFQLSKLAGPVGGKREVLRATK
ncbi:MAG: tRNA (5-methylaminomethyl-2-thiouridine)(34)-methyltransferase MnmD [Pirellulaceae bacterium]